MLYPLLVFVHVMVCLVLIGVVLLQTGKRADLAGAFGGGGSQTAFGTRGAATVLSKATTISAVVFMVTSIALAVTSTRRAGGSSKSVLDEVPAAAVEPAGQDSFEPDASLADDPAVPADAGTDPATADAPPDDAASGDDLE